MPGSSSPEFAPGIPAGRQVQKLPSVSSPRTLEFAVQYHLSEGAAGEHYDLRLGDPETGHAHSWALKHLPAVGEKRLAVQQPTHTLPYMDFKGRISEGYGKGQVNLAQRDKAEVLKSGPDLVRFNVYKGKEIQEYALRHTNGKNWLLHNVTTSRDTGPGRLLPSSKPSYGVVHPEKLDLDNPDTELQAKIDGAHVLYQFKSPGSMPRVLSYRPTERTSGVIEHTHKLPGFHERETPHQLSDTILRGELYAVDEKGKALPAARVGGILNASVWKSRKKQEQEGKLKPVVFDVVRFKGRDVEGEPYAEKKRLLGKAVQAAPWLSLPRTATTPEEKRKLVSDIQAGREPSTDEGVIVWHKDKAVPQKSKFLEERDVYVRSVFPETGAKRQGTMAGGFEFSLTPDGPVVGRVGSGMSHAMKRNMIENPSAYEGLKARVRVQRAPEHYAPRAPVFHSFHLDQEIPENVKTAAEVVKEAKDKGGFYKGEPASPDTVKFERDFQGLTVHVDRPKGFVMLGTDAAGTPWKRTYKYDYGFIPKTSGGDDDELDVFVGPNKKAPNAFWVVQKKQDGSFDEYKVMLGFDNRDEAIAAYRAHVPKKYFGRLMTMTVEMMKAMLGKAPPQEVINPMSAQVKKASWDGFRDELKRLVRGGA